MKFKVMPLGIALLLLAPLSFSQTTSNILGQFDFGQIPGVSNQPNVEINLNPQMLQVSDEPFWARMKGIVQEVIANGDQIKLVKAVH